MFQYINCLVVSCELQSSKYLKDTTCMSLYISEGYLNEVSALMHIHNGPTHYILCVSPAILFCLNGIARKHYHKMNLPVSTRSFS